MATKRRREDAADDGGVANTPAGAASKASTTTVVSADSERATTTTGGAGGAKAKAKKAKGGYLGSIVAALRQLKTPGAVHMACIKSPYNPTHGLLWLQGARASLLSQKLYAQTG